MIDKEALDQSNKQFTDMTIMFIVTTLIAMVLFVMLMTLYQDKQKLESAMDFKNGTCSENGTKQMRELGCLVDGEGNYLGCGEYTYDKLVCSKVSNGIFETDVETAKKYGWSG